MDWKQVIANALIYALLTALGSGAAVTQLGTGQGQIRQDVEERGFAMRRRLERIEAKLDALRREEVRR